MNIEYWHNAWRDGRIGFHQQSVNPWLVEYFDLLEVAAGDSVLVPLCGKSHDLLWLRDQACTAVGVEASDIAVNAFFDEGGLEHRVVEDPPFRRHLADCIEIIEGDFFALRPKDIDRVAAAFDRAALIALPEQMRSRYASAMKTLVPVGAKTLLLTLEFDIDGYDGPPFSVSAEEVERIYGPEFFVTVLAEEDTLDQSERFRERGAARLIERVFLLQR